MSQVPKAVGAFMIGEGERWSRVARGGGVAGAARPSGERWPAAVGADVARLPLTPALALPWQARG
jgi:cysteine sulfinate desulfinase/cysteine desulfurase-like protein